MPPTDGIVVCIDEMGPLATIPRGGSSWCKRPARRSSRYHRSTTIQLLAAFAPHTGHAVGRPSPTKTGEDIVSFLANTVMPEFRQAGKIYIVWDNFSSHKKALHLWTSKPTGIEFHLDADERFMAEPY
jgi:hypothetical protein